MDSNSNDNNYSDNENNGYNDNNKGKDNNRDNEATLEKMTTTRAWIAIGTITIT